MAPNQDAKLHVVVLVPLFCSRTAHDPRPRQPHVGPCLLMTRASILAACHFIGGAPRKKAPPASDIRSASLRHFFPSFFVALFQNGPFTISLAGVPRPSAGFFTRERGRLVRAEAGWAPRVGQSYVRATKSRWGWQQPSASGDEGRNAFAFVIYLAMHLTREYRVWEIIER